MTSNLNNNESLLNGDNFGSDLENNNSGIKDLRNKLNELKSNNLNNLELKKDFELLEAQKQILESEKGFDDNLFLKEENSNLPIQTIGQGMGGLETSNINTLSNFEPLKTNNLENFNSKPNFDVQPLKEINDNEKLLQKNEKKQEKTLEKKQEKIQKEEDKTEINKNEKNKNLPTNSITPFSNSKLKEGINKNNTEIMGLIIKNNPSFEK